MLTIGIETSGLSGSVALLRDGQSLQQHSLDRPGCRHAQSLVLQIQELLTAHDLTSRQVDAIAVSQGPGSFTGLRVGLVCAKTFAYATGCRFVAVDTFAAVCLNLTGDVSETWVVEDAQRGDLFAGHYHKGKDGFWQQTHPIELVSGEEWLLERTADEVVTGRGLARCALESVRARCLTEDSFTRPIASAIAKIGERRLAERGTSADDQPDFNFWKAVPFYIRPSAAEEKNPQPL